MDWLKSSSITLFGTAALAWISWLPPSAEAAPPTKVTTVARSSAADANLTIERTATAIPAKVETANFVLHNRAGLSRAREIAETAEAWRAHFHRRWLKDDAPADWSPQCEIFVFTSQAEYLAAVGQGGAQTRGSSLVEFAAGAFDRGGVERGAVEKGGVALRRIDLYAPGPSYSCSALPHELMHVVLADCFGGRYPPRWIDEGLATLADSEVKQAAHEQDLQSALRGGMQMRFGELLHDQHAVVSPRRAVFYGQSASLVRWMVSQGEPADFIAFARHSMDAGYDAALRKHYEIDGVAKLERLWHGHLATDQIADR